MRGDVLRHADGAGSGKIRAEPLAQSIRGRNMIPDSWGSALEAVLAELNMLATTASCAQLTALVGILGTAVQGYAIRTASMGPDPANQLREPDQNLSVKEAARRLGVSSAYLYKNARQLPFAIRIGRRLLFSAQGLDRWIRNRQHKQT